jgi:hypothetical protein
MTTVRQPSRQRAYAELARASARARLAGADDPVDRAASLPADDLADVEVNAWWAVEFAALGAWSDAIACTRRLPRRRAVRLLPRLAQRPHSQVAWS